MRRLILAAALLLPMAAHAQVPLPTGVRSFGAPGVSSIMSPPPSGQPLKLFGVSISPGASAGYLMVFESSSVPASGTVGAPLLRYCAPVAASTPYGFAWGQLPDLFNNSVVVAFSSTGCGTFTPATALWLSAQVQ